MNVTISALLARHFVVEVRRDHREKAESIADTVIEELMQYDWPGNIRELENIMERICAEDHWYSDWAGTTE